MIIFPLRRMTLKCCHDTWRIGDPQTTSTSSSSSSSIINKIEERERSFFDSKRGN
jgi:hypothetical protein